jgi:hypothetical protein
MKWVEHVACMVMRNAYRILVGKSERRPLGRLRHRFVVNVKMNLKEMV